MFYKLLRDICSQGHRDDGADEEPVPPHRQPVGAWEADLLLAGGFGAAFSAATA